MARNAVKVVTHLLVYHFTKFRYVPPAGTFLAINKSGEAARDPKAVLTRLSGDSFAHCRANVGDLRGGVIPERMHPETLVCRVKIFHGSDTIGDYT